MSTFSGFDDDQERELDEEGIPAVGDATDSGVIPPRDTPQGVEEFGTTVQEQRLGESLAERVEREEPDVFDRDITDPGTVGQAGRLVATDTDESELHDAEAGSFGLVADGDLGALSAEEAAMRVEDEPAGLTYDDDPGYLS